MFKFAIFAAGVFAGVLLQKFYPMGNWLEALGLRPRSSLQAVLQVAAARNRVEVPIGNLPSQRRMVAIVFGQSNAANFGESPQKAAGGVYNFYQGKLYAAEDPLLGAGGTGGSVWTRLGDKLLKSHQFDAVIFVPLGVGGAEIARWTPDGDLHGSLLEAIQHLKDRGLPVTHLMWHQGETDAELNTAKSAYKSMFLEMLTSVRNQGVTAPIYVAVATRCQLRRETVEIRAAQQELVNPPRGIYSGPDTDTLGWGYRYDGCHFSDEGLEKFAELWMAKLTGG